MILQKKRKILRNILTKTTFFTETLIVLNMILQKKRKILRNILTCLARVLGSPFTIDAPDLLELVASGAQGSEPGFVDLGER